MGSPEIEGGRALRPRDYNRMVNAEPSTYLEQTAYRVRFERGECGLSAIARKASILVVVDVLSFSTAVDVAISAGALVKASTSSVCARQEAERIGALSAVSRKQCSSETPYSLSPDSLSSLPTGSRLILPSPNGATLTSKAHDLQVPIIVTACLRNAEAVGEFVRLRSGDEVVAIIAAGERWSDGSLRPALEDDLGAGAVLTCLNLDRASPEARTISQAFVHAKDYLSQIITACVSARELIESGYEADVLRALEYGVSNSVPTIGADGFFRNA